MPYRNLIITLIMTIFPLLSIHQTSLAQSTSHDWPQWRGPDRNGISLETNWLPDTPNPKIEQLWQAEIGTGFSSFAIVKDRLYTMGNTAKNRRDRNENDIVTCLNAQTGEIIWQKSYPCQLQPNSYEGGPSATPTVENNRVYTVSKMAQVYCFNAENGDVIWSTNLQQDHGFKPPNWGFATSPVIIDNLILLNVGSAGVALDKSDGAIVWQSEPQGAGYASPLPFEATGMKGIAFIAARHFVLIDHLTGKELWRTPWKTYFDISGAEPIFSADHVFISSGYDTGGALYQLTPTKPKLIWESTTLRNQCNSSVLFEGHLYGFDGNMVGSNDRGGSLKCVEYLTGKEKWSAPNLGIGSLMLADQKLIVLSESGSLLIAHATPQKFDLITQNQILKGKCWTTPILANGRIYARNATGQLTCITIK